MTTNVIFDKTQQILKNIAKLNSMATISGILENEGVKKHKKRKMKRDASGRFLKAEEDKSLSMAEIAAVNEFGSKDGRIPERSFIREPVDEIKGEIADESENAIWKVVSGESAESVFHKIGNMMRNAQVKSIGGGGHAANAQSTIDKKGSSTPLFNTGILKNSIKYRVEK